MTLRPTSASIWRRVESRVMTVKLGKRDFQSLEEGNERAWGDARS
jgi:hypothetical protein